MRGGESEKARRVRAESCVVQSHLELFLDAVPREIRLSLSEVPGPEPQRQVKLRERLVSLEGLGVDRHGARAEEVLGGGVVRSKV